MRRRPRLTIQLDRHASVIRGHGAHQLICEASRQMPVWISTLRGFSVQEATARDVIALAESRGYDLEILGPRTRQAQTVDAPPDASVLRAPERSDPGGLW